MIRNKLREELNKGSFFCAKNAWALMRKETTLMWDWNRPVNPRGEKRVALEYIVGYGTDRRIRKERNV